MALYLLSPAHDDDELSDAVAIIVNEKVSGLPVVKRDSGELVGILTSQDVMGHIVKAGLL